MMPSKRFLIGSGFLLAASLFLLFTSESGVRRRKFQNRIVDPSNSRTSLEGQNGKGQASNKGAISITVSSDGRSPGIPVTKEEAARKSEAELQQQLIRDAALRGFSEERVREILSQPGGPELVRSYLDETSRNGGNGDSQMQGGVAQGGAQADSTADGIVTENPYDKLKEQLAQDPTYQDEEAYRQAQEQRFLSYQQTVWAEEERQKAELAK